MEPDTWNKYYSVSTGELKATDAIIDPAWKWKWSGILLYDYNLTGGQTVLITGQEFNVTGPHSGYTTYGKPIQYWELINKNKFLLYDAGTAWTQYIHAGDAILRYDAGNSRLLIHDDILRHKYYEGELTDYTVRYISNLTSSNSLPGSPVALQSSNIQFSNKPSISSANQRAYMTLDYSMISNGY